MSKDSNVKKFAIGAVLAAAAGYVAGILTAPKSGKETREDIKDVAQHAYSVAEKQLKTLHTELADLLGQAKQKLSQLEGSAKENLQKAIGVATVAKEKARDLLSAVHEGDAADADLKEAITEASKAVEHLKKYLKKA